MNELELDEIENRIEQYPPQARHDILRLARELRHRYAADAEKRNAHSPLYDPQTGLLNGGAYGVRFAMARARATRYRKMFAVMSVDVAFAAKTGRKATGTGEREQTIRHVAERLEQCVRATDTLARIGDENFAVILEDLTQSEHAERVKAIVEEALAKPMRFGEAERAAQFSVRMQFYPTAAAASPTN